MSGFPLPEVQWFSEGIPVHPLRQPYQQIYLVPTDSAHTTTYTCVGAIYQNNYYRVLLSEIMVDVTVIVEDNSSGKRIKLYYIATSTNQRQLALFTTYVHS